MYNVLETEDGGFVAYGYSESTNIDGLSNKGLRDAIIVKFNEKGDILWQKSWGGNNYDNFSDLLLTQDGGFVVTDKLRNCQFKKNSRSWSEGDTSKTVDLDLVVGFIEWGKGV
jgi:hypothetical protein